MTTVLRACACLFVCLIITQHASAQDTLRVELPAVEVSASRGQLSDGGAPAATSVDIRDADARHVEPALSLESVLTELPGIWLADRGHFAIGERLVVRGLGSRAAFGVRSVAVLLDGVLLTMPDGQAVLDPVEPAQISRAELIRGPASRFWGNAAGGVLSITSGTMPESGRQSTVRLLAGSHGTLQFSGETGPVQGPQRTSAYASFVDRSGFRDHASGSMARFGLRTMRSLSSGGVASIALNASDLDTQSPGSLTLEQWTEDPTAADARYVNTMSGKRATQFQASAAITNPFRGGILSASVFGLQRSLDNPLPFAWIGLERTAGGLRADWRWSSARLDAGIGADWRAQSDDRLNANNAEGGQGENTRVDQNEQVSAAGLAAFAQWHPTSALTLSGGLRGDLLRVALDDNLQSNGDLSGSESFQAFSPSVGFVFRQGANSVYGSVATAFEIPTTTELVNSPDGSSGFNENLEPQRLAGVEFGVRHEDAQMRLDLTVYAQQLTNFLSPYQLEAFPGRTFYRNVGEVRYQGLEAGLNLMHAGTLLQAALSVHRYEFASGDLEDNQVPGIPSAFGSVRATRAAGPVTVSAALRWTGAQFANDANTAEIDGSTTLTLRASTIQDLRGMAQVKPFVELTNLLDANHVISIVPNARGGRYFEGLPGRSVSAGMAISF